MIFNFSHEVRELSIIDGRFQIDPINQSKIFNQKSKILLVLATANEILIDRED